MKKIVMFGAGAYGKYVLPIIAKQFSVEAIIDTYKSKIKNIRERNIYGVPIISLEEYFSQYRECEIIVVTNEKNYNEIALILKENKVNNFSYFSEKFNIAEMDDRERLVSYADPNSIEDIILYNIFREEEDIFYIDIGSYDPLFGSVTQTLYDKKGARGINVEPQQRLIDFTNRERKRDINICAGVGEKDGVADFYIQDAMSTFLSENIYDKYYEGKSQIQMITLKRICEQYISKDQEISFLKIDVEGYEKNVLLGADFQKYRPKVVVIESTLPMTDIPCYDKWEYILTDNRYHFVFEYGVNRYYVADECSELDERFVPILELMKRYHIYTMKF